MLPVFHETQIGGKKKILHNNLLLLIFWTVYMSLKFEKQAVVSRVEQSVMTDVQTTFKKRVKLFYIQVWRHQSFSLFRDQLNFTNTFDIYTHQPLYYVHLLRFSHTTISKI